MIHKIVFNSFQSYTILNMLILPQIEQIQGHNHTITES